LAVEELHQSIQSIRDNFYKPKVLIPDPEDGLVPDGQNDNETVKANDIADEDAKEGLPEAHQEGTINKTKEEDTND